MSEEVADYSFEQKERLARRIQKLKKQKYLTDIESIIVKHNPNLDITTNPSGKFMYFQDLSKETYYALERYVRRILKYKTLSETSDSAQYVTEIKQYTEDDDPFSSNPKLRYSNKERNLIKRRIYDKQISDQNDDTSLRSSMGNSAGYPGDPGSVSKNNVFVKRKTPELPKSQKVGFDLITK